ncbi:MAG: 3-oxoacyl-ACP reductase family protein [Anaerolineales bacterium]|nr:3-oxoacyl-ACP reductase family protein [Anaerolineales bacterium]HJN42169.1 3-oxoacyl-ACP reductase family protein [Anaerolineales bacterium]
MDTNLQHKVAIVTGGGSGIGKATALALAREGAQVVALDVNVAGAEASAAEIKGLGFSAAGFGADVSVSEQVQAAMAVVAKQFGGIDILVNCAGVAHFGPLMDLTMEDWDQALAVNLKGTVICCKTALPYLRKQHGGHIVNIGSVAGLIGGEIAGATYSASKAGVGSFTKSLAKQFGTEGIIINCINPGPVASPMTEDWPAEWTEAAMRNIPLRRFGRPEEIAAIIVFLVSGLANYLHGSQIDVNGGMYMG